MSSPAVHAVAESPIGAQEPARVWLVSDVYPPGCGGSGWSAHALARTLIARGHAVEVVSVDPSAAGVSQRVFEDVRITEVGVAKARRSPLRRFGATDYAHATLERYLVARLEAEPDVRVVHAQHLHSGPPAVAAARAQGRAAVQTLRDYWPVCLHGTSWWGGGECSGCSTGNLVCCMKAYWGWPRVVGRVMVPWARRRLRARCSGMVAAGRVITVSEWVRRRIGAEAPEAHYVVLPNIVDAERASADAAAARAPELPFAGPYLVAAGKLTDTKGFDLMLRDLAKAQNALPVVIAGSGPARDRLEEQTTSLEFEVFFAGWTEHASLLALMHAARALLLPGAWNEPLSRLLLEAMALGTPVLAWTSGGNTEHLTNGENAWIVDGPDALRLGLNDLEDVRRHDDVGAAGQALAQERFSPEAVYPRLLAIYGEALEAAHDQDNHR